MKSFHPLFSPLHYIRFVYVHVNSAPESRLCSGDLFFISKTLTVFDFQVKTFQNFEFTVVRSEYFAYSVHTKLCLLVFYASNITLPLIFSLTRFTRDFGKMLNFVITAEMTQLIEMYENFEYQVYFSHQLHRT